MKIAFHFVVPDESMYIYNKLQKLLKFILKSNIHIQSKIYQGDILFPLDRNLWHAAVHHCFDVGTERWGMYKDEFIERAIYENIFCIVFETIGKENAAKIHDFFFNDENYIGAYEINEADPIHWSLYQQSLFLLYMLNGKRFFLYYDYEKNAVHNVDDWKGMGFESIEFLSYEMKRTIFDKHHTFEHAQHLAMWRKEVEDILISIVDGIVYKLDDAAPEMGQRLLVALNTYKKATCTEEYAQMALTCRRLMQYLADTIFPPRPDDGTSSYKLGKQNYNNRLLAFVQQESTSKTNTEVIEASLKLLAAQVEKISNLQNKGLHDEVLRGEARRCLLRTILMIDDILSVREMPLPPVTHFDNALFNSVIKGAEDDDK